MTTYEVAFADYDGQRSFDHERQSLTDDSDAAVEAALADLEQRLGRKLPLDTRTDFPSFTLYGDGEEIGGG